MASWALVASGCFSPEVATQLQCADTTCPPDQFCQAGVCRPGVALCDTLPVSGLKGEGTDDAPYVLCTPEHWADLVDGTLPWDGVYLLGTDIVLPTEGEGQQPVGHLGEPFSGKFNGGGHAIVNARVNRGPPDVRGVFGVLAGPIGTVIVRDLALIDAVVEGDNNVGALAGSLGSGTVQRVSATGQVTGLGNKVGGLIGFIDRGTSAIIEDCHANVEVRGSEGNLFSHGGLVGRNDSIVRNSFAAGTVTANTQSTGGLLGGVKPLGAATNSFVACTVLAEGGVQSNVAQIIGNNESVMTRNNHYDNTVDCLINGTPCELAPNGHPTEYFFDPSNPPMDQWDFQNTWQAHPDRFPSLRPPQ